MQIPMKVDYGVRALVDLAQYANEGPVRANEIARRTAIPEPYLAQVLHALGRHGMIRSQRGPQGGHVLDMDASEINLGMVMECLDNSVTLVGCLSDASTCVHSPACAQQEVWRTVEEAVKQILDSTSIGDLVKRTSVAGKNRAREAVV
jgi:Rrf2 family protein